MAKATQHELSEKNPYWIPRNRYYELKYFCLQFDDWNKRILYLENLKWLTEEEQNEITELKRKIDSVISALETTGYLKDCIIEGVTKGISYDTMSNVISIPCSRVEYYDVYRKFFYELDISRRKHGV